MDELDNNTCIVTIHAYKRAKKRLKWNNTVLEKMSNIAFNEGISHSQTKGQLHKYLDKIYLSHKKTNNVKIHGENVFLFKNKLLITIYRLPNNLIKYLPKIKK